MINNTETSEPLEEYYQEISDGCGCTEMWEFMAEWRRERGRH